MVNKNPWATAGKRLMREAAWEGADILLEARPALRPVRTTIRACRELALIRIGVHVPFTLDLNVLEHLNVTTRLAERMASSPVAGFRPFLSFLSFT